VAHKEVREAFNEVLRRGFGRGQDQGKVDVDDLDKEIEQRQRDLDALVQRRDNLLFKEDKGA